VEVDWPDVVVPDRADQEVDDRVDVDVAAPDDAVDVEVDDACEELAEDVVPSLVDVAAVPVCVAPTAIPVPSPRNAAALMTPAATRERAAACRRLRFGLDSDDATGRADAGRRAGADGGGGIGGGCGVDSIARSLGRGSIAADP
jgi:hypothetical protein